MNIKKLDENDLINMENNLQINNNKEKEQYIKLYLMYRNLFTEYIIEKLNLKEYDDKIKNSKLNFRANNLEEIDSYQYFSFEELQYFYVRNNIYLENLDEKDINILKQKIEDNNYELDDVAKKMIEKTYEKVITPKTINRNEKYVTFFGPLNRNFMAPNDNIIIGFRYDEFNNENLTDEEWDKLHDEQFNYLYKMFGEIEKNFPNVTVIQYSEFSTIPRIEKFEKNA